MKKNGILLSFGRDPLLLKFVLIMKLSFFIILLSCLHVAAGGFSQNRISVDFQSTQLKRALSLIEKKSNFRFLYNERLVTNAPRITLNMTNAEVTEILNRLLNNTGLSYQLMANNLVILKTGIAAVQDIKVSGRVTSTTGEPVAGASVLVKNTSIGTTTDGAGNYSLTVPDSAILVFSSLGFDTQEIPVNGKATIDVSLKTADASSLQQVVVVGYGTSTKRDLTAPVAVINTEDLNKRMTASPMQALQGNVTGVQVITSGAPGGSPTVKIRGVGSFNNTSPLYVVDGMFVDNIDFLNTNDIGEMSILKDASAAAIYGVRAANGVVIITTKKGKYNQKTRVTYNGYFGVQKPTGNYKLADGPQYAAMQLTKLTKADSARVTNSVTKFGGSGVSPTTNTDWYDEILKSSALMHNHSLDLSGGASKVSYTLGLNYFYQDGVTETESSYKRYNGRLQIEAKPYDFLKMGITAHFTNFTQRNPNAGAFYLAYLASPLYPVFDATNTLAKPDNYASSTTLGFANGVFNNPVAAANYWYDKTKGFQVLPSVYLEADIIKNKLSVRSQLSQRYSSNLNQNYIPEYYVDNIQQARVSVLTTTQDRTQNYILDNLITYRGNKDKHHWTVLLGQSARQEQFRSTQVITDSIPPDQIYWYADQGPRRSNGYNETGFRNTSISYFGRLEYNYAGKYLLTGTFRADGTSKYQEKWGYFPSVGVGWVISDEGFMNDSKIINLFKLRGSWGKLGNDNVPPSTGYAVVYSGNDYSGIFNSTGITNGVPTTGYRIDPLFGTVRWEVVDEWDIGIDFTILNKRLKGSVDYYNRRTNDLAFERTYPFISNVKVYSNWGKVNNSGFEVSLDWNDKLGELGYHIGGNVTTVKNEVIDLAGQKNIPGGVAEFPTQSQVGEPFNFFYGWQVAGVYQNQAEINADPIAVANNVKPGYFRFADVNNDKKLDENDRVNLGSYLPKINYGFNLGVDYKNFDLSIFFQGVGQSYILNNNRAARQKFPDMNGDEKFVTSLWTGEGSTNKYPSAIGSTQSWNNTASSFFVENGSYLRLQNIQLGYNFKLGGTNGASFRIYATADRPVIWTRYSGITPEIAAPAQLPKDRAAGPANTTPTQISSFGYDNNVYPTTAVYSLGVRITY